MVRAIVIKTANEPNVLSTYNAEAQKVNPGQIIEELFAFGNHLYDIVASKATAFTNAVGNFVSQLQQLEVTLRNLFGSTAPAFLDGLLSNPTGFITNLLTATGKGFDQFFSNLPDNLQGVILDWVKSKIPADLPITAADLPDLSVDSVAGFALKVMGLTRDDFIARVANQLGADNAQLLVQAYDFVQDLLSSDDPKQFITNVTNTLQNALNELGGGNAAALLDLNPDQLKDAALDAIKTQVLKALGNTLSVWARDSLKSVDWRAFADTGCGLGEW